MFLSADTTNPKKLVDAGLADGDAVAFAGNELTVIVPADNPARIASAADLAKPGIKIIAAGDEVPITRYATQLVENLGKEAGYPDDFAAAYTKNIASREDNVKAVVAKIELGEGDAGIVYVTDARASTKVATFDVPSSANVPATYAGVVVKASANARRPGPSSTGSPDRMARRSSASSGSCRPRDRGGRRARRGEPGGGRPIERRRTTGWSLGGALAGRRRGPVRPLPRAAGPDAGRSSDPRRLLAEAIGSRVVLDALVLSLVTTAISLTITVAFGLPLAFVLARRRFRGKGWLEAIVDLPIVLPPSVAGLALLLVFGRQGLARGAVRTARRVRAVHHDRGHRRPDVRVGAVLHPLGTEWDRRRGP